MAVNGTGQNSQVRFGSTVDWNGPQLGAHTQVLSNHSRQGYAGDIDEPPGQGGWRLSVVDPAADQVKEVHRNGEVKALFPSTDEKPQAEGTVTARRLSAVLLRLLYIRVIKIESKLKGRLHVGIYS